MSGNGISWAICKSAPRSRQITTPAPHRSVFYRPDALPVAQPIVKYNNNNNSRDNVYDAVIVTKVIARVQPVHLMNVD